MEKKHKYYKKAGAFIVKSYRYLLVGRKEWVARHMHAREEVIVWKSTAFNHANVSFAKTLTGCQTVMHG